MLETLDLSGNRLSVIRRHYFYNLPTLKTLLLDNNQITQIQAYSFSSFFDLQIISLLNNRIRYFPPGAMSGILESQIVIETFYISNRNHYTWPNLDVDLCSLRRPFRRTINNQLYLESLSLTSLPRVLVRGKALRKIPVEFDMCSLTIYFLK